MKQEQHGLWREALRMTSLGWDLALPIFGGVLLGYFLDQVIGTRYILTVGLLMLGIGAGFYNLFRSIRRVDERARRGRASHPQKRKGDSE